MELFVDPESLFDDFTRAYSCGPRIEHIDAPEIIESYAGYGTPSS